MTESSSNLKGMVFAPPESIIIEPWLIGVIVGIILMAGIVAIIFKLLQENVSAHSVTETTQNKETNAAPAAEGFAEYQKSTVKQPANVPVAATPSVSIPMQQSPQQTSVQQQQQQKAVLAPAESIHYYDEKQFHDEEDSMAEYGYYGENGQFNEDGSFIGLYGQDRFQAVQDRIAAYAAQTQAQLKQLNSST